MYGFRVDSAHHRVVTTWGECATDELLVEYQRTVWSDPALDGFDELIDLRALEDLHVTTEGLRTLASMASSMGSPSFRPRLALVVGGDLAFGLARMYEAYRESQPTPNREVRVFRNLEDAEAWLSATRD